MLRFSDASMWIWCYQCYVIKMRNIINSKWESKFEFQIYSIHISNLLLNAFEIHLLKFDCSNIDQSLKFEEFVSLQMHSNWINTLQMNEHTLLTKYLFKREKFRMISIDLLGEIQLHQSLTSFERISPFHFLFKSMFCKLKILHKVQNSSVNNTHSTHVLIHALLLW